MIAYIKGKLVHKDPTFVIVEANGIGYHINISLSTFTSIKDQENCVLHTYLHIKDDGHTLYGFGNTTDKKVFLHLISISGVGPSTGLVIQSSLSAKELQDAIVHEDVHTIQSVKGIGAKTAQRIILELKDKMLKEGIISEDTSPNIQHNTLRNEALEALVTLGIGKIIAEKTINKILKNAGNDITLEELIKQALKAA